MTNALQDALTKQTRQEIFSAIVKKADEKMTPVLAVAIDEIASKNAEIAGLVAALEEVKRGLDQMFGDNVGMNGDGAYARCADFAGPIIKAAIVKVRKP